MSDNHVLLNLPTNQPTLTGQYKEPKRTKPKTPVWKFQNCEAMKDING